MEIWFHHDTIVVYFDELRPNIISNGPIDRFAWVEITDLPIICWNASAITKVLSSYGRVIGFDKISYRYSSLGYTNILRGCLGVWLRLLFK